MHNSIIYPADAMNLGEWFNMLANQGTLPKDDLDQRKDEEQSVATYICLLDANNQFIFNGKIQNPGSYFVRISSEEAAMFSEIAGDVHKFSFSEIVFCSDIFSLVMKKSVEEMSILLEEGE